MLFPSQTLTDDSTSLFVATKLNIRHSAGRLQSARGACENGLTQCTFTPRAALRDLLIINKAHMLLRRSIAGF